MLKSRRLLALFLFTGATMIALLVIGINEARRAPDWQAELSQYFAAITFTPDENRIWVSVARRANLVSTQNVAAVPTGWPWQDPERLPAAEQALCIRFDPPQSAEAAPTQPNIPPGLLIAYHDDRLWRAGWLVYRFRPGLSRDQIEAIFIESGCDAWEKIWLDSR